MSNAQPTEALSSLLTEERNFPPSEEFVAQSNAAGDLYERADEDRLAFWAEQARRYVTWETDFAEVLDWSGAPFAKWFVGGRLNACVNAVDRHIEAGNGDRVALHFVGEPGDEKAITYAEIHAQAQKAANALGELGIGAGDTVAIYMPNIPDAVVAMLACARVGAPHSVVFGGFSAEALHTRIMDVGAKLVITTDGVFRRGAPYPLKPAVDEALQHGDTPVEHVLVVKRTDEDVAWVEGRDIWWDDALAAAADVHVPEFFDAEHPLFILYTSGTTGKPKGILHTTGGYLVQSAYTNHVVHDVHPESDVYWCTADIGWVTGHSYVVYGPMSLGATQVIYEGTPDTPHKGRFWEIVRDKKVSILYTAPTAIRTFMKWGKDIPAEYDLSSLRLLGSVGEPINPEAWMWYRDIIGGGQTPIVDTWWQTETGAIVISPLPGLIATRPGSAQHAVPGTSAQVVDDHGDPVPLGSAGYLVLTEPWPAMLRGIWGDPDRYRDGYWSRFPGVYFAGDGARVDEDGNIWISGRIDDVMNVSGHRLSTAEVESALVSHAKVAEAAVVGATDDTTGQAICAFVILRSDAVEEADEVGEGAELVAELRAHVAKEIGSIAKPKKIMVVGELPKTRSGKIMRRLLRDVAENRQLGDVTTLADSSVMSLISAGLDAGAGDDD